MMCKKGVFIGCVSVVVMMQASEKNKKVINNVDQLRREIRSERDRFNQDQGRSYVDQFTRDKRVSFEPGDKKVVDSQKKESI